MTLSHQGENFGQEIFGNSVAIRQNFLPPKFCIIRYSIPLPATLNDSLIEALWCTSRTNSFYVQCVVLLHLKAWLQAIVSTAMINVLLKQCYTDNKMLFIDRVCYPVHSVF